MGRKLQPVISKIREALYLGNQLAAQDENLLLTNGIKRVVSVVEQPNRMPSPELCERLNLWHAQFRIPADEDEFEDEAGEVVNEIFPWIKDGETNLQPVLVHCHGGISRSPSLVITYLVWDGTDFTSALNLVAGEHRLAAPSPPVLKSFLKCTGVDLPQTYSAWLQGRLLVSK